MVSLILNPKSGSGIDQTAQVVELLHGQGLEVQPFSTESSNPMDAASRAMDLGSTTLIAAGGDGTVNAVASAVVGSEVAMAVLPTGTLNHFAKDMNIPLDLEQAARVIAAGRIATVDVGEINGRIFLNNSSLGIYPRMAMFKEEHRRMGRSRAAALFSAVITAARRIPFLKIRLCTHNTEILRRTPLMFVGNNEYALDGAGAGTRETLTAGNLCVYIVNAATAMELIRISVRALLGHIRDLDEVEGLTVTEAFVTTGRNRARVSIDGEAIWMDTPLHYRIRPASLRVLVP